MYLIRNFASLTEMKLHDMNRDGLLDCYRIAITTWWEVLVRRMLYWLSWSFFGSRDLVQDRLPIQKDRLVIMVSAVSRMAWRHEDMIRGWPCMIGIWNSMTWESLVSLGTGMASDGNGGEEVNAIGQKSWDGFLKNNYFLEYEMWR